MIRRTKPTKSVRGNPVPGTKRIGKDEISPELKARIESPPGGGLSDDIIDNAFWLEDDSNLAPPPDAGPPPAKVPKIKKYTLNLSAEEWPWVQALDRLDRHDDAGPLGQLLKSYEPSPRIEKYIEDFIQRSLARGRGRPATPAYMLSDIDALLLIACESVRAYVQRGDSVDTALDKVRDEFHLLDKNGREFHLNKDRLSDVYNGRRPSLRESKKRL
jgi:hypothetical protein